MARHRDFHPDKDAPEYRGALYRYDLIKEATAAFVGVVVLIVTLSILFGSPDPAPSTFRSWSAQQPGNFVQTSLTELDGSSESATYGPPYNDGSGSTQALFGLSPQTWAGVTIPVDAPTDFVLNPLASIPGSPLVRAALTRWKAASAAQQKTWTTAYGKALGKATFPPNAPPRVSLGDYGPVATLMAAQLQLARSGGLDAALLYQGNDPAGQFYRLDYTKQLLYLADGGNGKDNPLDTWATNNGLQGDQWGLMNEAGGWPGQFWLWAYAFPYQIDAIGNSQNADIISIAIIGVVSLLLLFLPFIPGLRAIPRIVPVHRLIWRRWYREFDPDRPGAT